MTGVPDLGVNRTGNQGYFAFNNQDAVCFLEQYAAGLAGVHRMTRGQVDGRGALPARPGC